MASIEKVFKNIQKKVITSSAKLIFRLRVFKFSYLTIFSFTKTEPTTLFTSSEICSL